MENKPAVSASPVSSAPVRERRVGTLTFGVTLVACGLAMLTALFFPELDLRPLVKLSPLLLILLGCEVLWAARRGSRIKYDWIGMILCFLIVCTALCLFAAAWSLLYYPDIPLYW